MFQVSCELLVMMAIPRLLFIPAVLATPHFHFRFALLSVSHEKTVSRGVGVREMTPNECPMGPLSSTYITLFMLIIFFAPSALGWFHNRRKRSFNSWLRLGTLLISKYSPVIDLSCTGTLFASPTLLTGFRSI